MGMLMVSLVVTALIVGTAVATVGLMRARDAAQRARTSEIQAQRAAANAQSINAFLGDLLATVDPRYGGFDHRELARHASITLGTNR